MSNAERQRNFRKSHPGYYARIQAAKRASAKRGGAQLMAAMEAAAKTQEAAQAAPLTAAVPLALPMPPERLMLPAPVEVLVFPGLKTSETLTGTGKLIALPPS